MNIIKINDIDIGNVFINVNDISSFYYNSKTDSTTINLSTSHFDIKGDRVKELKNTLVIGGNYANID